MKRFTETTKWDDPWFLDLSAEAKIFWVYLLDKCDNAGVIDLSHRQAQFSINGRKQIENLLFEVGSRLIQLHNNKLMIKGFIEFQFGELNTNSNLHKSVINLLDKHQIKDDYFKGMPTHDHGYGKSPSKGKGIGKGKGEVEVSEPMNISFDEFWNHYDKKVGKDKCLIKWSALSDVERTVAINHITKYKKAQPDKQFRKNPDTYLNQKAFNDEIVSSAPTPSGQNPQQGTSRFEKLSKGYEGSKFH